jgi:putative ABC transport system ATP-binding protein
VLDRLDIAGRARALPGQLSGGEAARAGLAVALVNRPAILLADEPTGEVDTENEERMIELLADAAAEGAAVVVVTHSVRLSRRADRLVRLLDGSLVR